jgi:methanethiol S-methyltransferase
MGLIAPQQIRAMLTDRRRLAPFMVALTVYAFAGVTVPLLLLFAGGWWLPKTVGTGPHLATAPSVVIDVALLGLFGLQHSGMARPAFKALLTRWVPEALERTAYVAMACLAVWVLCLGWQPLPRTIWSHDGIVGSVLDAGFWLGFALVYAATLLLNHFHLLGLSQAYRAYVSQVPDATSDRLQVHGPYRLVRHPSSRSATWSPASERPTAITPPRCPRSSHHCSALRLGPVSAVHGSRDQRKVFRLLALRVSATCSGSSDGPPCHSRSVV